MTHTQRINDIKNLRAGVELDWKAENQVLRDKITARARAFVRKEDFHPGSDTYQAFCNAETRTTFLEIDLMEGQYYPQVYSRQRPISDASAFSREYQLALDKNGGNPYVC